MVHKFACVYLKIIPNQLSKGSLYRKMMHYGFKLSTKHPPETNNHLKNSYLKSIRILAKNETFYNIPIKIKIFCIENNIGLKYFADIKLVIILVKIDRQK